MKWWNVFWLSVSSLFAMSLWFSGAAVIPQLSVEWNLQPEQQSWITGTVQIGFVAGALISSVLNLGDRFSSRWLFAGSAFVGAIANALIAWLKPEVGVFYLLRFVTGASLAGVYPPGMKLMASWCKEDRGFGIGILVGSLTFGKALPHLLNGMLGEAGMPPWELVFVVTSGMAGIAAVLAILFLQPGPHLSSAARFDWRFAADALRNLPSRLANFGYLGHMWELYAMWTWAPLFLLASYQEAHWSVQSARIAGFGMIAIGAAGCLLAGTLADKIGRTVITTISLVISGMCCLGVGFFFHSPAAATVICLIWGFAVVADSAQFSAAVTELSDPRYVGTALTVQTCLGFLLTLITVSLIPPLVKHFGWERVFAMLAIGPVFGIWNMLRLRRHPDAIRMASGNR